MTITENTHLTDESNVRLFCKHIVSHKYKYNNEKQFTENRTLSATLQAILNRLVAEARDILSKDDDSFEHQLKIAANAYNQQKNIQQHRHSVHRMILQKHITGTGIY